MIDQHVRLADLGKGIAAPPQLRAQRRLGRVHPLGVDRVVDGDTEGFPQRRRVRPGGFLQARQPHLAEAVERPRREL